MPVKQTQQEVSPSPQPKQTPTNVLDDIAHRLVENKATFLAFLHRRVSNEALAENLLQQSFIRAMTLVPF